MRVEDNTINGKCSNCGNCCGDILPLKQSEINRIIKFVKRNNIKEENKGNVFSNNMTCPFRNEKEKKCNVYEVRPEICREFICNISAMEMNVKPSGHQTRSMKNAIFNNKENESYEKLLKI